jgi:hypothetical protein
MLFGCQSGNLIARPPSRTDKRNKAMRKRKAGLDDDGDVTYINDANKVFNKKINRYFDKYTAEYVVVLYLSLFLAISSRRWSAWVVG